MSATQSRLVSIPKKKQKKYYKKNYKSSYRGNMSADKVQKITVWRGLGIVPDRFQTKLRYNEQVSRGGAIIDTYVMSANDIYDPNTTGVGSQPTGHDQLFALYKRCVVLASKIKLKIANQATMAFFMSLVPTFQSSTTFPTGYNDAVRLPYAHSVVVGGIAGNNVQILKHYINCAKFTGDKGYKYETNYSNTVGSGPASAVSGQESDYFIRWFINATSADLATNMLYNMDIEITYYCEFYGRLALAQS